MRLSSFIPVFGLLIATVVARAIEVADSTYAKPALEQRGLPAWQWYFGVDAATHQTNFNKWSTAGYRLISLSTYGTPSSNLYAAVWVQRAGVAWIAIHNSNGANYQTWFDNGVAAGYVSTIITVTGSGSSAIFAGVMEQISVGNWYQKCGLTEAQYSTENSNAIANRFILKSFTEYGTASSRQYCGIWYYNDQFDKYTAFSALSYGDYQNTFNSETTKPFWRPSYVTVSEDHTISAEFTDTDVGVWYARHGLTGQDLQTVNTQQVAANRYIISLQGGGTGDQAQFAAIWAEHDIATPRSWRTTGTVTGFTNNANAISNSDTIVESFMKQNGIRQMQFSVGKNGKLIMERAYSWSESTRATTSPSDTFLLASLSKIFVEATIQHLYNIGKLNSTTRAYPLLGYTNTFDPRLATITVQELLDHTGGLDDSISGFDPTYQMREIALVQSNGARPATVKDVVDYMSKKELDFTPGAYYAYSNYGYLLLSYVVKHVTGVEYYEFLESSILTPGNYDVIRWEASPASHVGDPVTQESQYTGLSALQPLFQFPVAQIFGGDGMYKDSAYGPAALAASASTMASFINTHGMFC